MQRPPTLPPSGAACKYGTLSILTGTKAMLTKSFLPPLSISVPSEPARSAKDFPRAKLEGRKLSMVTCYDYTFARLLVASAVDGILVGDSVAMVIQGHPSTGTAQLAVRR